MGLSSLVAKSRTIAGALAPTFVLLAADAAFANSSAPADIAAPLRAAAASGQPAVGDDDGQFHELFGHWQSLDSAKPPAAARVTFSRAGDGLGRPVYLSRSTLSGSGVAVSFSRRRPPIAVAMPMSVSMSSVALPSHMPVAARALTSGFGMRGHPLLGGRRAHRGVDLAAPVGTPIVATSDGIVSVADWNGGYGLYVALEHGGGMQTRYGHMSRLNVAAGQNVRKGDVIGFVGSTGRSTGPHVHYEVRVNGQAVNPLPR